MKSLAAFIVAALWLLSPASATTRRQAPAAKPSGVTVEGTVVDSVTGQPIEGVHVAILEGSQPLSEAGIQSLLNDQKPTVQTPQVKKMFPALVLQGRTLVPERATYSVMTDAGGKFAFTEVAAGPYVVAFRADGYTYQVYGQKSDSVFVPPTDIHEGKNDLGSVSMRPELEVTGRIIDPSGGPIASIPVYLLNADPYISVDGDRSFQVAGEAITDAKGTYLIKKIVGGHYYILAGSFGRGESFNVRTTPDGARSTEQIPALVPYPYTYYPGVGDIGLAWQIDVPAGRSMTVKDTVVTQRELKSIRGRVVDSATGKPPESIRVELSGWDPFIRSGYLDSREILGIGKYDRTSGTFEFVNRIPGHYRVEAMLPAQQVPGQPAGPPPRSAYQLVELTDSDVKDLLLSVPSNGQVTGKVVISEGKDLPVAAQNILPIPLQLMFRPLLPLQPTPFVTSVSVRDGTFDVDTALEGKYRFSLGPLRDNYYVSEARVDGMRAANGILEFPKNAASELILVVSPGGEIQGTAVDPKGKPVGQAKGVVLPDPLPEIIPFYQTIYANNEGHFSAGGIPPGNYKIYVWDGADPPQMFDRELLARSSAQALRIHVETGSHLSTIVTILTH